MQNYLDSSSPRSNLIIKHSFNLVFKKIETVFFILLCVICLITSKLNREINNKINNYFVSISRPVVKIISIPINTSIDVFINFNKLILAKKENIKLKEELFKLQNYYLTTLAIHQENKELRNALNFVKSKTENYKIARLIGMSHQAFNQKILIDSGLNRNIKEGQIITGNRGVIGRVAEIFEDKSRIMLLTDANSRIPIIASRTRNRGILAGNNSGLMEILYLPKNHQIAVGDKIFTSSDGDVVPPGLLVGVVRKIDKNFVYITGVEDINNLNIVSIIDY
ncbi:MAG: rod shape-determining protein MreC [Proteobacteria bacterium]|nr:rod shape-determining protein MreC [Pseudomonadota bacterium]NCA27792.1 rod shape-determining protein MreC [Pseudomonadota bacterium]